MAQTHVLHVHDRHGDTTLEWRTDDFESIAAANALFDKMADAAYLAYTVDGEDCEKITAFDPSAPETWMTPQHVGG